MQKYKLDSYKLKRKSRTKNTESEHGEEINCEDQLGYFVQSNTHFHYTVPIDSDFVEPSYYRGVIQMMMNASENDVIAFLVNSDGGSLAGLLSLLEALNMTSASSVAIITGNAASAASMFALHCDEVYVSDNATMLCHNGSFGTGGKITDVLSHAQHINKTTEKLMYKTYKFFLTEQEIRDMLSGKEIYLDSEEIIQRLEKRQELRNAAVIEAEQQEKLALEEAEQKVVPVKRVPSKPRKKV